MKEEIIEGNKLIAEFMGWKFEVRTKTTPYKVWNPDFKSEEAPPDDWVFGTWLIEDYKEYLFDRLKYHSSWDYLMPAWKKLGGIMYEIRREVSGEACKEAGVITVNILKAFQKAEIDAAFNWLVEGVKWYNTNHPADKQLNN